MTEEVEVYLGEGIWWRVPAHKAVRYSSLPQRAVRAELERQQTHDE